MALLFDVVLDAVLEERPSYRNEVSEHAVEDGTAVADHSRPLPRTLTITATIAGPDWESRYQRLIELAETRPIGSYVGVTVWENVTIESFEPSHTVQISNGVQFTMTLKQVRVARLETRAFIAPDPVTAVDVEPPPVERGFQQEELVDIVEEAEALSASWLVNLLFPSRTQGGEAA